MMNYSSLPLRFVIAFCDTVSESDVGALLQVLFSRSQLIDELTNVPQFGIGLVAIKTQLISYNYWTVLFNNIQAWNGWLQEIQNGLGVVICTRHTSKMKIWSPKISTVKCAKTKNGDTFFKLAWQVAHHSYHVVFSINQSINQSFLEWPKWHCHCKVHCRCKCKSQ